jgi:hypothetical protein
VLARCHFIGHSRTLPPHVFLIEGEIAFMARNSHRSKHEARWSKAPDGSLTMFALPAHSKQENNYLRVVSRTDLSVFLRIFFHSLNRFLPLAKNDLATSVLRLEKALQARRPSSPLRAFRVQSLFIQFSADLMDGYTTLQHEAKKYKLLAEEAQRQLDEVKMLAQERAAETASLLSRLQDSEIRLRQLAFNTGDSNRNAQFIERRKVLDSMHGKPRFKYVRGQDPVAFLFEHYGEFIEPLRLPSTYLGIRGLEQTMYLDDLSHIDPTLTRALKYSCSLKNTAFALHELVPPKSARTDKIINAGLGTEEDRLKAVLSLSSRAFKARATPGQVTKILDNPRIGPNTRQTSYSGIERRKPEQSLNG